MESSIKANIEKIRDKIAEAALRSGRKASDIKLMAVTKGVEEERIREAITVGIDIIGENYVQEGQKKIGRMGKSPPWHLIGHLQANKAKYAVRLFEMIHSVDRMELAYELDKRSRPAGLFTNILIEVNLSGEKTKSGISKEGAIDLIRGVSDLEHLSIQGLMTMPPWFDNPEEARPYFAALRNLKDKIASQKIDHVEMRELSMGMSSDYQIAIEEGATIVRIGRSIFGERRNN